VSIRRPILVAVLAALGFAGVSFTTSADALTDANGPLPSANGVLTSTNTPSTAANGAATSYVDGISDQSLPEWDGNFDDSWFAGLFDDAWVHGPMLTLFSRGMSCSGM
jgi:hypothetical protein